MNLDFENLSENILRYRRAMGITQETLAYRLGVTSAAVSKWERKLSCPDISLLPQVAELFGVSIDNLFEKPLPTQLMVEEMPWEDDGVVRVVVFDGKKLCTEEIYLCPKDQEMVLIISPNGERHTQTVGHHTPSTPKTPPE